MTVMAVPPNTTAGSIADIVGGRIEGPADLVIRGVEGLDDAGADQLTLITSKRYARRWGDARAGAALISRGLEAAGHDATRRALIEVPDAEAAMTVVLSRFAPPRPRPEAGVHPSAVVHPSATLAADTAVGPHVSIDRDVEIGAGVVIHAGVRIYAGVRIGAGSEIHANAVIREHCVLGRSVILHAGAVIGTEGFGYRPAPDGSGLEAIPHLGNVVLEDRVEVGSNTCIDRGKFSATVIGQGTKLDNLIQIAHNVRIGRHTVVAGMSGIAGSTRIGDGVQIGGGVSIFDHISIGDGAKIGARSGVLRPVKPGESVFGYPADRARDSLRQVAALRKLPDLIRRLTEPTRPPRG